jgi:hypothetical protein
LILEIKLANGKIKDHRARIKEEIKRNQIQMKILIATSNSVYTITTIQELTLYTYSTENAQELLNFNLIERTKLEKLALLSIDFNLGIRVTSHY